jgi:hypothetical protein
VRGRRLLENVINLAGTMMKNFTNVPASPSVHPDPEAEARQRGQDVPSEVEDGSNHRSHLVVPS